MNRKKILALAVCLVLFFVVAEKYLKTNVAFGYNSSSGYGIDGYGYDYAYDIEMLSNEINSDNEKNFSFAVSNAYPGGTYVCWINDEDDSTDPIYISGSVETSSFHVENIDVSDLKDGTLTVSFYIIDSEDREGTEAQVEIEKIFTDTSIAFSKTSKKQIKNKTTSEKTLRVNFRDIKRADYFMRSTDENFTGKSWRKIKGGSTIALEDEDKKQHFYFKFKDKDGNESAVFEVSVFYKKENRVLRNAPTKVNSGQPIVQWGKRFSKKSQVALYFSRPEGGYFDPMIVNTDKRGGFSVSYTVNKPAGTYSWYAVDLKTKKKSDNLTYKVLK